MSDPTPCLCGHTAADHDTPDGRCSHRACGCNYHRPAVR